MKLIDGSYDSDPDPRAGLVPYPYRNLPPSVYGQAMAKRAMALTTTGCVVFLLTIWTLDLAFLINVAAYVFRP